MRAWVPGILCSLVLAACGTDTPSDQPTIRLPVSTSASAPLLFNNGQGVPVGSPGSLGFGVMNGGTAALVVQSVTYLGDPAITSVVETSLPATLAFNEELVVDLTCTPADAGTYPGVVSVASNATNAPLAQVFVSCVATR